jgi:hypothetical protein
MPARWALPGEAIEDEVEVDFAGDGDVQRYWRGGYSWKDFILFCCARMSIVVIIT